MAESVVENATPATAERVAELRAAIDALVVNPSLRPGGVPLSGASGYLYNLGAFADGAFTLIAAFLCVMLPLGVLMKMAGGARGAAGPAGEAGAMLPAVIAVAGGAAAFWAAGWGVAHGPCNGESTYYGSMAPAELAPDVVPGALIDPATGDAADPADAVTLPPAARNAWSFGQVGNADAPWGSEYSGCSEWALGSTGGVRIGGDWYGNADADYFRRGDDAGRPWPEATLALWRAVYTTVLVIAAGSERMAPMAALLASLALGGFVQPAAVHWTWDRLGWLSSFAAASLDSIASPGVVDWAGAASIHVVAGGAGLVLAALVGARTGRFVASGAAPIPGRSATLRCLGAFLLWFGHYGLLMVSGDLGASPALGVGLVGRACTNGTLAAGVGGLVGLAAGWFVTLFGIGREPQETYRKGVIDLDAACQGVTAGLVSASAAGPLVPVWAAVASASTGAILARAAAVLLPYVRVDDPHDVFAVHAVGGVWSLLSVGLFADTDQTTARYQAWSALARAAGPFDPSAEAGPLSAIDAADLAAGPPGGLLRGGSADVFVANAFGALAVLFWSLAAALVIFGAMRVAGVLRVSPRDELHGYGFAGQEGKKRNTTVAPAPSDEEQGLLVSPPPLSPAARQDPAAVAGGKRMERRATFARDGKVAPADSGSEVPSSTAVPATSRSMSRAVSIGSRRSAAEAKSQAISRSISIGARSRAASSRHDGADRAPVDPIVEYDAAVAIQSAWRGKRGREEAEAARRAYHSPKEVKKREKAAARAEAEAKKRQKVETKAAEKEAKDERARYEKRMREEAKAAKAEAAAAAAAAAASGGKANEKKVAAGEEEAAVKIQAAFRGKQARDEVVKMREEKARAEGAEASGAVTSRGGPSRGRSLAASRATSRAASRAASRAPSRAPPKSREGRSGREAAGFAVVDADDE